MSDNPSYASLLGHLTHHNFKDWIIQGCLDEDANTIRRSVERIPERRLKRRFARLLAKGVGEAS